MWLWLSCRPAATAPKRPLAWEPPYAASAALKRKKKKKRERERESERERERKTKNYHHIAITTSFLSLPDLFSPPPLLFFFDRMNFRSSQDLRFTILSRVISIL